MTLGALKQAVAAVSCSSSLCVFQRLASEGVNKHTRSYTHIHAVNADVEGSRRRRATLNGDFQISLGSQILAESIALGAHHQDARFCCQRALDRNAGRGHLLVQPLRFQIGCHRSADVPACVAALVYELGGLRNCKDRNGFACASACLCQDRRVQVCAGVRCNGNSINAVEVCGAQDAAQVTRISDAVQEEHEWLSPGFAIILQDCSVAIDRNVFGILLQEFQRYGVCLRVRLSQHYGWPSWKSRCFEYSAVVRATLAEFVEQAGVIVSLDLDIRPACKSDDIFQVWGVGSFLDDQLVELARVSAQRCYNCVDAV